MLREPYVALSFNLYKCLRDGLVFQIFCSSSQDLDTCYINATIAFALSLWNKHRAARILLHQKFLEATVSMNQRLNKRAWGDAQQALSQAIVQEMATNIIARMPSALSGHERNFHPAMPVSLGGYFVVWSLQVVLRCPFVSFKLQGEARKALEQVGRQCGISYATLCSQTYAPEGYRRDATQKTSP